MTTAASTSPARKIRRAKEKAREALAPLGLSLDEIKPDPKASARAAGLRYVSDSKPGITRHKSGKGFSYRDVDGHVIRAKDTIKRINALAIPPAYRDVWICPDENGHIQAVGIDERGRKQYRYHERWREVRDEAKYARMIAFAEALPLIRERVAQDIKKAGMPREKVLAALVQLLEKTAIRVGNAEYARQNESYGLSTMQNEHVDVEGAHVHFHFKGKSGKFHEIDLRDRRLARIVAKLQELPGQDLFQYQGADGAPHNVSSDDVNAYLQEITGQPFTAKDFRTWVGTLLATRALQKVGESASAAQAKKNVNAAIKEVSSHLGNTPSVCRKCYVHPAVLDSYLDGSLLSSLAPDEAREVAEELRALEPEELAVVALLQKRLAASS